MPKSADFILNPNLTPVVLVEPYGVLFNPLITKLAADPMLQVVECVSAMDALAVIRLMSGCLLLLNVRASSGQNDIKQHLSLMRMLAPQIGKKSIRVLVTVEQDDEGDAGDRLSNAGAADVVQIPFNLKVLEFKIDRLLKMLAPAVPPETVGGSVQKGNGTAPAAPTQPLHAGVRLGPELSLERAEDYLFSLAGAGIRRTDDGWQVRLKGPRPEWGRWLSLSVDPGASSRWRWVAAGEVDPVADTREWIASGAKPEYRDSCWNFSGERPTLGFFIENELVGHKFAVGPKGAMIVAADSRASVQSAHASLGKAKVATQTVTKEVAPAVAVPASRSEEVIYVEALSIASDCWLLLGLKPKREGDRWSVPIVGPSARMGQWIEEGPAEGKDRRWVWIPRVGAGDDFVKEMGRWTFFGLAPVYRDGEWSFVSAVPLLAFESTTLPAVFKFSMREDGALLIARDSKNSVAALPAILNSIESPRVVQAPESSQPFVPRYSPLALAFLVSELLGKSDLDPKTQAFRYCSYLGASCGGARVELWVGKKSLENTAAWTCAGASHADAAVLGEVARGKVGRTTYEGLPVLVVSAEAGLAGNPGALVLQGEKVGALDLKYQQAMIRVAFGILRGLAAA